MIRIVGVGPAVVLLLAASPAVARTVAWVDWTSSDSTSVYGVALVDGSTVAVTYTGERGFVQTTCGTNYWSAAAANNPYINAVVDNPPDTSADPNVRCDIIALHQATSKTLVFSQVVTNPLFAVVSLNGNGYRFDRDFDILGFGPGYWGNGTLTKQITTNPDGSITYDLIGSGEPHGVIQFIGSFQSVTWNSLSNEFWNGFSIAVENLAVNVPPEIEVSARGVALVDHQAQAVHLGSIVVGTSTAMDLVIGNTGTGPLNISGMTVSGSGAASFAIGPVPPAVAAGGQISVQITFTASTAATRTATVTIVSDDADEGEFDFLVRGGARVDTDGDGVIDAEDNCPGASNAGQDDLDGDEVGDACDDDVDGDGRVASVDCDDRDASVFELAQYYGDADGDGLGDPGDVITVCRATPPAGYVSTATDNCPGVANSTQVDADADGLGDACDDDDDGDGVADVADNCAGVVNMDQADLDGDGQGDACDGDVDGDGALTADDCDDRDATVSVPQTYAPDPDGDMRGDPAGRADSCSSTPPAGFVRDATDNCPAVANADQADTDGDGRGDACESMPMPMPGPAPTLETEDGGCACGATSQGSSTPMLLWVLALVALRRRARPRRAGVLMSHD